MSKIHIFILSLFFITYSNEISFSNFTTLIEKGNSSIDFTESNNCISPQFSDWDQDGLTDMIVGYWATSDTINWLKDARIRFYKNYGTNEAPIYNSWEHLQAAGKDILEDAG